MKRALATVALVVAFAPTAWAGEMTPANRMQPLHAKPGMSDAKEIEGMIESMDRSGKSVTLEDGTTLTIPDSLKAGRAILKEGAMLRATYQEKGGEKIATSLEVQSTTAKPKS